MKKLLLLSLVTASALMADPLVSYPGTKAKGMGGAFTAVANNNSAMYFNPAGMVDFDSNKRRVMVTAEVGTGGAFDTTTDEPFSSTVNYFVAAGITSPSYGMGVGVYSLYSVKALATDSLGVRSEKNQDISALSASGAYALAQEMYPFGGKLSVGATLGIAFSGGGLINYETTDEDGTTTNNFNDSTLDQRGFYGAVGVKARVFKSMTFNVDVAANYRSAASMDSVHDESTQSTVAISAPTNGMDMPSELAYGIAAMYLTEYGVLTVTADKKLTGYEEATSDANSDFDFRLADYDTLAFGVDFSGPVYQVRAGMYQSDLVESADPTILNIDVSGYTFGAGLVIGKSANIEFSVDNKTYENASESHNETFASLSLNISN